MDATTTTARRSVHGERDLEAVARRVRATVVELSHHGRSPHLGSCLSCVDVLVAAYFYALDLEPERAADADRDRFLLSKGHAAPALYAALCERGFFSRELLERYNGDGEVLAEQPSPGCVPGMEAATGSLGHGLPLGAGMALAARIARRRYRVFVLMSDGECNEGSVWEAAMFAPAHRLGNLCTIVDYNRWQATGRTDEILALAPLADKLRAFGWRTLEVDGHDVAALAETMRAVDPASSQPTAIVAHTVKGKGVSFMEDDNNWHYRIPTAAEVAKAQAELGVRVDLAHAEPGVHADLGHAENGGCADLDVTELGVCPEPGRSDGDARTDRERGRR